MDPVPPPPPPPPMLQPYDPTRGMIKVLDFGFQIIPPQGEMGGFRYFGNFSENPDEKYNPNFEIVNENKRNLDEVVPEIAPEIMQSTTELATIHQLLMHLGIASFA